MIARQIVAALSGRWHGSYGLARCPSHDDRRPSLKVAEASNGADAPTVHCFAGCDWREVKEALRRKGLLPEWKPRTERHGDRAAPRPEIKQEAAPQADEQGRIAAARRIWQEAVPAVGTLAER